MSQMPVQKPGRSKQDYGTPKDLLFAVKNRLKIPNFSCDIAASPENAVCDDYITEEQNALTMEWPRGWNWLNPPFEKLMPWVHKASDEAEKGASTVMLVPASVGSNWWSTYVEFYAYAVFLNPRITFVGEKHPYPKDCALLFYTPFGFTGHEIWRWK